MDISVIVTAYNESQYVEEGIRSVLSQTLAPSEILLVDGGSTDETPDILERYAAEHESVSCLLLEDGPNIPEMRNRAVKHVSGDLVTFLDGDDRFRPEKLEREMQVLADSPDASIVFSDIAYIDSHSNVTGVWSEDGSVPTGDVLKANAARDWPRGALYRNELVPRDLLYEGGLYDEQLPVYEDWDLKIRMAAHARAAYCPRVLTEYRRHDGGISTRSSAATKRDAALRVYRKHRSMLEMELSATEFRTVSEDMKSHILRLAIFAATEHGNYHTAWQLHRQWLALNPEYTTHVPTHVSHLFPPPVVTRLGSVYSRIMRLFGRVAKQVTSQQ